MSTVILALAVVVLGLRAGLDGPGTGARAASLPQPPDSEAPPGAPPHWIPSDEWVMQHWRHLRDDRRTIYQLAE